LITCAPAAVTHEHTQFGDERFASTELDLEARGGKADLTEKRRIENATTPMRRSVKAQSTPPNALRSRPPPPAAAGEASGSAIAASACVVVCVWVEGAEIPVLDPGGDEDLATRS